MLQDRMSFFLAIVLAFLSATLAAGEPSHVKVSLVPEVRTIAPGTPFTVAVVLKMDPRWHTYWINPGDSGAPTEVEWSLPPGFEAGPIQWPHPERIEVPPLVSFGYEGEVALLVRITPPRDLKTGERVTLTAHVSWLECEELCLPGEATVSAEVESSGGQAILPVPPVVPGRFAQGQAGLPVLHLFSAARARLPLDPGDWKFAAASGDGFVRLTATPPAWLKEPVAEAEFFPETRGQFSNGRAPWDGYVTDLPLSDESTAPVRRLTGVLVSKSGWRGPGSERAIRVDVAITGNATASGSRLPAALGLAFLGGLILNLMPCVFPVLSLKVLSLAGQAEAPLGVRMRNAGAYSLGVLAAFWALAGLLIALRAGGEQLGWGFQLQSPPVVAGLASLFFLMALNLFGVFEVGLSLTRLGGKSGASFSSGLLATVVATPCTAPFMGSALGFALTQPAPAALAIFTALGAGMAAPFVVLAASPRLLRFLPRPGAWMETMKQALGFLLAATVVWLAWVLGRQTGSDGVALLLAALVVQAAGAWVLGRWAVRRTATVVAIALILGGAAAAVTMSRNAPAVGESWEPYSEARVHELRAAGRPVFVDFGAAWCLTCQVNERVALSAAPVLTKFRDGNVATLKADWTSRDPAVTAALTKLGRSGVPTYVLYPKDPAAPPRVLPEILTPTLVIDALNDL